MSHCHVLDHIRYDAVVELGGLMNFVTYNGYNIPTRGASVAEVATSSYEVKVPTRTHPSDAQGTCSALAKTRRRFAAPW